MPWIRVFLTMDGWMNRGFWEELMGVWLVGWMVGLDGWLADGCMVYLMDGWIGG